MASSPTSVRTAPRWVGMAGWSVLAILGTVLLAIILTLTFGEVHGTEFCPQTFERRSYSYYELPVVQIQVRGEVHEDLTGDTEKCVTSHKFIVPPTTAKKDWHVLVGSRGTRQRRPGDAGILLQYLDASESGSTKRWVIWSEKNEELAKVFWPAVQELALHDLYVFMPDLFDLTKVFDDPIKLKNELDAYLKKRIPPAAGQPADQPPATSEPNP